VAKVVLCPNCRGPVPITADLRPPTFPFCSKRCKMVDLGKWFDESFTIPAPIDPNDYEAIQAVIAAQQGEG